MSLIIYSSGDFDEFLFQKIVYDSNLYMMLLLDGLSTWCNYTLKTN